MKNMFTIDVAVVGAGIMGLSVAHALRGANVTLFDAGGFPADNASAMAGGMLAPWSEIEHLPEHFHDAALEGIRLWREHFPALVKQNGSLIVAHKDDEYILARLATKLPKFPFLGKREIAALEPGLSGHFTRGLHLPDEAHINPAEILAALASTVSRRFNEEALPQDLKNRFDFIIDCRGFAVAREDKNLRGVKGEVVFARNAEFTLSRPVRLAHPRYPLYIVPRPDHVFMIGATVVESADSAVTLKSAMELLSAAYTLHPSFAESEIVNIKAGVRPAYPDNLPRIAMDENIIRCNGLFRHGYLLAPVMAKAVADYVAGHENKFISLFMKGEHDADHDQRAEEKNKRRA